MIAGGVPSSGAGGPLAGAELYDPSTGTFSATGSMTVARVQHTATLLPSGKVLIAGGDNLGLLPTGADSPNPSAELYDPKTGMFAAAGNLIVDGSYDHTATLLQDG